MVIRNTQSKSGFSVVIQAGGQSRRMGQDKALIPFLGRPLISRIVERLTGLGDEMLVTTNAPLNYAFLQLPLHADLLPGMGALGGLYTALAAARYPVVAVVACDMPFIEQRLLRAQRELLEQENVDVVIPRSEEGPEPLHAVYRRETCLPAVRAALDKGLLRMTAWFPEVSVREMMLAEIKVFDPGLHSFVNANTPEELQKAESLAKGI